jgi:hypothetical protein
MANSENPQAKNAGNEGDVMKHAPLQEVVDRLSKEKEEKKEEFWYVETHTGCPYYFLPEKGKWQNGIGHLMENLNHAPQILKDFADIAYHDKHNALVRFPYNRTYLGSAAQVFHILKDKEIQVRMTLFELDPETAQALVEYFHGQGATVVHVAPKVHVVPKGGKSPAAGFVRGLWDAAVANAQNDDLVMVVQGNSYDLAEDLWQNNPKKPHLVLVDPFGFDDHPSHPQPETILDSLKSAAVPFICWTPLLSVPKKKGQPWPVNKWSFQSHNNAPGVQNAQRFVDWCTGQGLDVAWFSWMKSAGANQTVYGCQLTFGNIFDQNFTPASIWGFQSQPSLLPHLDLMNQVDNLGQLGPNFQNPAFTWQAPGSLKQQSSAPGNLFRKRWWEKYHAAFWWP